MEPVTGVIKNYEWGSPHAIPGLLGVAEDGLPQAEYWLGAHPSGPARIRGTTLDKVLSAHPEYLCQLAARPAERLPFMLKVLAAAQPLSLQAHPNAQQAQEGYQREEEAGVAIDDLTRTFKDPYPKAEMLVALEPMDALVGFRDPAETLELFAGLGLSDATLQPVLGPLRYRGGAAGVAEVFLDALGLDEARRHVVDEIVAAAVKHEGDPGALGVFARTAVQLDQYYPGDSSLISALLLNNVHLKPGEAFYLPSGTMHAYQRGVGIELQTASDNVARGGLTHKHIDVPALVQIVDFTPRPVEILHAQREDAIFSRYHEPDGNFSLWRAELQPGLVGELPGTSCGRILLVVEGRLSASSDQGRSLDFTKGGAMFIPAGETVMVSGEGLAFLASTAD